MRKNKKHLGHKIHILARSDFQEETEILTPVLCSICDKTTDKFKCLPMRQISFFFFFFPVLYHSSKGRKAEESSLHHCREASTVAITKGSFVQSKAGH